MSLNDYFSTAIDTVAVFDSNFNQLFPQARPLKCRVTPRSRLMDHPLENGQIISDYKIDLPIEAILPLIIPALYYRDIYAQIYNLKKTATLLMVQTRATNLQNMIIQDMPEEETADMFDSIMVELHLREVQIVQSQSNFSPTDPTQSSTVNTGNQQATATVLPANSTTNNPQAVQSQLGLGGAW